MDWPLLAQQLDTAVLAAFDDWTRAHPESNLYALALVTEDGAMSVGLAANTEEAHAASLVAAGEDDGPVSAEDAAWARWGVGEWAFEGWGEDRFEALNRELSAAVVEGPVEDMATPLDRLVETMTTALARLRGARGAALDRVVLFVTLTDSDAAEAVEDASARRLNPPPLLAPFLRRFPS